MMTLLSKTTLGGVLAAAVLALPASSVSAAIACTGNVCWHTPERYEYPPSDKETRRSAVPQFPEPNLI
jgi:hypothetical protein